MKSGFPSPSLSGRCRLGEATFAGMGGKEEDAPNAALPVIRSSWRRGRELVGGDLDGDGSANRTTRSLLSTEAIDRSGLDLGSWERPRDRRRR